jgi:hypothetical protein
VKAATWKTDKETELRDRNREVGLNMKTEWSKPGSGFVVRMAVKILMVVFLVVKRWALHASMSRNEKCIGSTGITFHPFPTPELCGGEERGVSYFVTHGFIFITVNI